MRHALPAAIGAALLLSGCSTTAVPKSADAGPPPTNYRQAVAESVRATFFDPYSVRDATISQPLYASAIFDGVTPIPRKAWIVCVRANAKNRMGGYIGQQPSVFVFEGEKVVSSLSGPDFQGQVDEHCKNGAFVDFDEIEGA